MVAYECMRLVFTEDFFKNVIGFAAILIVGIAITVFAGGQGEPDQTATVTQTVAR